MTKKIEYCSYKGLTHLSFVMFVHNSLIIEYCSYKGLTLNEINLTFASRFIEYCSYKGLTPLGLTDLFKYLSY